MRLWCSNRRQNSPKFMIYNQESVSAFLENSRNYFTATFSLQFQHRGDVCYIAYHYPYTHSRLLADLTSWQLRARNAAASLKCQSFTGMGSKFYFRVQNLTSTLLDNLVPLVTVTEADCDSENSKGNSLGRRY